MEKMGFNQQWVDRVMRCVESVTYKIKVNGVESKTIWPRRGIRQGDPISPYLFILCQQWLSFKLNKLQEEGKVMGVKIAEGAPRINHLLFADDCLIFVKAEFEQLGYLKELLKKYEELAGQKINYEKSEVTASKNVNEIQLKLLGEYLGMKIVDGIPKYLGLPLSVGRSKSTMFKWIEDKFQGKIHQWNTSLLSSAGKETLIKSCLQAFPIYTMTCFKLPISLCKRLSGIAIKFWWAKSKKEKGIHWVRRNVLQMEKEQGGLGFKCFETMNNALLMKQLWRICKHPELLFSRIIKAKYLRRCNIFEVTQKASDSYAWKSLCGVVDIFRNGVEWDGYEMSSVRWKMANSGTYNVKDGYQYAYKWKLGRMEDPGESSNREEKQRVWKMFWRMGVPDRVKQLSWRILHNAIPVGINLVKRGCGDERVGCCFCGFKDESTDHVFRNCWWARAFWRSLGIQGSAENTEEYIADWLWSVMKNGDMKTLELVVVGNWVIWKNRNLKIHNNKEWTIETCKVKVINYLRMFSKRVIIGKSDIGNPYDISPERWTVMCDGAWDGRSRSGGYAVVIMKEHLIWACRAGWLESCESEIEAEVRSVIEGIELADHLGLDVVDIVSDSTEVVWRIQNGHWEQGLGSRRVLESMRLLSRNRDWSLRHVFREINVVADYLAKHAKRRKWAWKSAEA